MGLVLKIWISWRESRCCRGNPRGKYRGKQQRYSNNLNTLVKGLDITAAEEMKGLNDAAMFA